MNKLLFAVGIALALGVGIFGVLAWRKHLHADEIVARHEKEARKRLAEIRSASSERPPHRSPAVDGNGWTHLSKALAAYKVAHEAKETSVFPSISGEEPEPPPHAPSIDAFLDKHAAIFEGLRTSLACRSVDPAYRYEDGFALLLPEVTSLLSVNKAISDVARLRHSQERDDEALEWIALGLGLGVDGEARGVLVNRLVTEVIFGIQSRTLREVLDRTKAGPAALAAMQAALDRVLAQHGPGWSGCGAEWAMAQLTLVDLAHGRLRGEDLANSGLKGEGLTIMPGYYFSMKVMVADALEGWSQMTREIEELERLAPLQARREADTLTADLLARRNPLLSLLVPAYARLPMNIGRSRLMMDQARIALALARHRAEHGVFPKDLAALAPAYLTAIPEDPFTRAPYRYELRDGAAVLWSLGADLDDDGAAKPVDWEEGLDGDVVVTLR